MRLLRVLEQRAYEPLGGTAAVKANVRVLAATHRDLSALVAEGRFRQDLYYRINVLRLDLPPLRRRKEDIPPLVDHFITRFNHLRGKAVTGISEDALSILMAHDYPGNIRELENIIERAFVLCPEGRIDGRHLADDLVARAVRVQVSGGIDATRKAVEAQAIQDALRRTDGNREKAAALLGVHKSTLFRKIKALGIRPPDKDGRAGRKRRR
jgi:transcriptional regulator with PAS, ATPase and Fis domain